ncbi:MAG: hypothetical protein AAGK33_01050 [Pseudomonadota bacterium]
MFIRFVSNNPHPTLDAELGMFETRKDIDFSQFRGSVQKANEEAFYWFTAASGGGLAYPRLKGKVRTPNVRKGLFWFREDGRFFAPNSLNGKSVIDQARNLAAALRMAGCEIREIRCKDPGRIIWEDRLQVLAVPKFEKIPKAF